MSTRGEDIARTSARTSATEARKGHSRSKVVRALSTAAPGEWMTVPTIAHRAVLSEVTVRARLKELLSSGRVVEIGHGTRRLRYSLKEKA